MEYVMEYVKEFIYSFSVIPELVLDESIKFENIQVGDHLLYETPTGRNIHFYVVAKNKGGEVRVCGRFYKGHDDLFVEEKVIATGGDYEQGLIASSLKISERVLNAAALDKPNHFKKRLYMYGGNDTTKEMERLKDYEVKYGLYGIESNNSEHFVTFVKTGKPRSGKNEHENKALWTNFLVQLLSSPDHEEILTALEKKEFWQAFKTLRGTFLNRAEATQCTVEDFVKNIPSTKPVTGAEAVRSAVDNGHLGGIIKTALSNPIKTMILLHIGSELIRYFYCWYKAYRANKNGHMCDQEYYNYWRKQTATSGCSLAVGIAGNVGGFAVGAAIGSVIPFIGTGIGAVVGGILGSGLGVYTGTWLGRSFGDYINTCFKPA